MLNAEIGRPELRDFIVATKPVGAFPQPDIEQPDGQRFWPKPFDAALRRARELYCAGTHEMAQARAEGHVIQYLIPRKTPVPPRPFPVARAGDEVAA